MYYKYLIPSKLRDEIRKNSHYIVRERISFYDRADTPFSESYRLEKTKLFRPRLMEEGAPRMLFFEEIRGNKTLYVLRDVLSHANYEKDCLKDIKRWIESKSYSDVEIKEVEEAFEKMGKEQELLPLPQEYRDFDANRFSVYRDLQNDIIYEMPEWRDNIANTSAQLKDSLLQLLQILEKGDFGDTKLDGNLYVSKAIDKHVLVFAYDEKSRIFILLDFNKSYISSKYDKYRIDLNNLKKLSVRCYPSIMLQDKEAWLRIENDDLANLALSVEELETIQEIRYPFFINGLAGSGKSTILYYLFAYVLKHQRKYFGHKLLFLSYSKRLVANAKKTVKAIISANHDFIEINDYFDSIDRSDCLDSYFMSFMDFLKSLLRTDEELDKFSNDRHINYNVFQKLYRDECQLPEKNRYSDDLVWSTIRSFIKGANAGKGIPPKEYEQIKDKNCLIDIDVYSKIYAVWDKWYKKYYEEKGYWDDLDLVRYLLTNESYRDLYHQYAVIFCDEAQDFTKVESDFILKMSVHSKYDLTTHPDDKNIPLAFAGDPNQTISPTGFTIGSIKDVFKNSFEHSLSNIAQINTKDLEINYRSKEGIVKMANSVQMIRHHLLKAAGQKPSKQLQEAWFEDDSNNHGNYVSFFFLETNREAILNGMKNAFIISADEGEYHVEQEPTDENLKNVNRSKLFTALTSKGLEFKTAVLYGFGSDNAIDLFTKQLENKKPLNDSQRNRLLHFFTKLYIAVSRARQVLYVVDTKDGYNKFWKYFVEDKEQDNLLRYISHPEYKSQFGKMSIGKIEDFASKLMENYNALEYANYLFEQAKDGEIDIMKRAKAAYQEAQHPKEEKMCDAYIAKYEKSFEKAASLFAELGETEEAINCAWEDELWDFLVNLISTSNDVIKAKYELIEIIANFLSKRGSVKAFIMLLQKSIARGADYSRNKQLRIKPAVKEAIVKSIMQLIPSLPERDITERFVSDLDYYMEELGDFSDTLPQLRGDVHYRRASIKRNAKSNTTTEAIKKHYEKAILLWGDEIDNRKESLFTAKRYLVKTKSEDAKLLFEFGKKAEILKLYSDSKSITALDETAQSNVFSVLANEIERTLTEQELFNYVDSITREKSIVIIAALLLNENRESSVRNKLCRLFVDKFKYTETDFSLIVQSIDLKNKIILAIKSLEISINEEKQLAKEEEERKRLAEAQKKASIEYERRLTELAERRRATAKPQHYVVKLTAAQTKLLNTKSATYKATYELAKSGELSISEIARERGLSESSIAQHISNLVEDGILDYRNYLSEQQYQTIISVYSPDQPLPKKNIYEALSKSIDYAKIEIAIAEKKRRERIDIEKISRTLTTNNTTRKRVGNKYTIGQFFAVLPSPDCQLWCRDFFHVRRKDYCKVILTRVGYFLRVEDKGYYYMSEYIYSSFTGEIWVHNRKGRLIEYNVGHSLDKKTDKEFGYFEEDRTAKRITYTDFKTNESFTVQV